MDTSLLKLQLIATHSFVSFNSTRILKTVIITFVPSCIIVPTLYFYFICHLYMREQNLNSVLLSLKLSILCDLIHLFRSIFPILSQRDLTTPYQLTTSPNIVYGLQSQEAMKK